MKATKEILTTTTTTGRLATMERKRKDREHVDEKKKMTAQISQPAPTTMPLSEV